MARTVISFLLSLDFHLWAVVAASWSSQEQADPPIEISLVRLPAPREGSKSADFAGPPMNEPLPLRQLHTEASPEVALSRQVVAPTKREVFHRPMVETTAAADRFRPSAADRVPKRNGPEPLVSMKVITCAASDRAENLHLLLRQGVTATDRKPEPPRAIFEPARVADGMFATERALLPEKVSYQAGFLTAKNGATPETDPLPEKVASLPVGQEPALKAGAGQFAPLSYRTGGDTRPILEIIQARIDAVAPLVHRTSGSCKLLSGEARVSFRLSPSGYSEHHRLLASSGHRCLDERIEEVLHLAEPYPYLAGWIPVRVNFAF